jgi:hypothetical protein
MHNCLGTVRMASRMRALIFLLLPFYLHMFIYAALLDCKRLVTDLMRSLTQDWF